MEWTKTKTLVTVGVAVLLLVAMAVVVKLAFFPSVNDRFFQISPVRLRQAPPGLVIVRPTHFPDSPQKSSPPGMMETSVKDAQWMVGRNVTLQQLIAIAFSHNPGRIVLPLNAPKGNYDYLVTVPKDPQARLQSAIRRKLGYTAQVETRDTSVLALKVENPNSPGLKISVPGERENTDVRNGKLYFTHQHLTVVTDGLEQMIKTPVVDKTGLTNFYDFSLVWNQQMQQQITSGTMDQATGQKILADWGLGLEPDTASLEMLVVKKAN
jgi:uncharacterized protein (TIGR03435 family)